MVTKKQNFFKLPFAPKFLSSHQNLLLILLVVSPFFISVF